MQLRKRYTTSSWGDIIILFNEMVLGPLITLFLFLIGSVDMFMVISTSMSAYRAWHDWEEYHSLRSHMQDMALLMFKTGGPQIRTNDPQYFPYVIADAVVRLNESHQRS